MNPGHVSNKLIKANKMNPAALFSSMNVVILVLVVIFPRHIHGKLTLCLLAVRIKAFADWL